MSRRLAALLAVPAALALTAGGCSAQPAPKVTGEARIDQFLADLAAKRRDVAVAQISSIESLSGQPNAVDTPAAFVDKLIACRFVSAEPKRALMYQLRWQCADGDYLAWIDPDFRPPRITVGQFVSAATWEERRKHPLMPPPPPAMTRANTMPVPAAARRFLAALKSGQDLAHSEFADAIQPEDMEGLRGLKGCAGEINPTTDGKIMLATWDCGAERDSYSMSAILGVEDDRLITIKSMPALRHPRTKPQ
jgi:hypothetical protein